MKTSFSLIAILFCINAFSQNEAEQILKKVDKNMISNTKVMESQMTIYGKRRTKIITSRSWTEGDTKSFTEYLSPAADKGTKMLKLDNQLWIYTPETDRTIQISGHMLRQSVMGSDLSYEDMMETRALTDMYSAKKTGNELLEDRTCYILELTAKVTDVTYYKQKIWVDAERFVPLKQELYAKSGQLLKRVTFSDVKKIGTRWFPMTVLYKDMLKDGIGTEFKILSIQFDTAIDPMKFNKASLRK
jgi:outer membrane lipoprotein-sorting protein